MDEFKYRVNIPCNLVPPGEYPQARRGTVHSTGRIINRSTWHPMVALSQNYPCHFCTIINMRPVARFRPGIRTRICNGSSMKKSRLLAALFSHWRAPRSASVCRGSAGCRAESFRETACLKSIKLTFSTIHSST